MLRPTNFECAWASLADATVIRCGIPQELRALGDSSLEVRSTLRHARHVVRSQAAGGGGRVSRPRGEHDTE